MNTPGAKYIFNSEYAIFLSAMINQAYQLFEKETLVLPKGFTLLYPIDALAGVEEPEAEVFGFVAESRDYIVVVFRGTRTFKDNESDQDLYQVPYPFVKDAGKTHRGFTCIYQSARDRLIRELYKLSPSKRLLIAGPSLGGADPVFASRFNQTVQHSIRIFNIHDIIPTLPAKVYPPPFTKNGLCYQHVNMKYPLSFQLNSLAVRNHEIVCYFKALSQQSPGFVNVLCNEKPGFCPDTELCVPFLGGCGENESINPHQASRNCCF